MKVLQGKLDKQKEQAKSLEDSLKACPKPQDSFLQEGGGASRMQKPPEDSTGIVKTSVIDRKVYKLQVFIIVLRGKPSAVVKNVVKMPS